LIPVVASPDNQPPAAVLTEPRNVEGWSMAAFKDSAKGGDESAPEPVIESA